LRYRVRNIYDWGGYSNVLTAIAAKVPAKPAQPITSNTGASVKIAWVYPDDGGSPITSVLVEIRDHGGTTFYPQTQYCNGISDATVQA
jgi:hypothetical protein